MSRIKEIFDLKNLTLFETTQFLPSNILLNGIVKTDELQTFDMTNTFENYTQR